MSQEIRRIYINGRFLTQPITGVQRYAHEVVKAFDRLLEQGIIDPSRYRFTLLIPTRGLRHEIPLQHIALKPLGQYSGHAWEQWELPFHHWDGVLFSPGNTAPLMSYLFRRPVVVTVHSVAFLTVPEAYSRAFRLWYRFLTPFIMKYSRAVITVSRSEQNAILQNYPQVQGKIHVIQNGGLPEEVLSRKETLWQQPVPYPTPYILFVGSLSRGKNLTGVLKALEILLREQDVHLVVVGSTARTFHKQQMEISSSLQDRIHFAGQIENPEELLPLYHQACCLAFPSFYEASSLPPLEAMACGCPVVASDIPALRERCGTAALYCSPEQPESIAAAIRQLLQDGALRERLIRAGYQHAAQFTWDACARKTFEVIEQVFLQEG